MSNIHTLSSLGKSSTAKASTGHQIGSTVYRTVNAGAELERNMKKKGKATRLGNVKSLSSIGNKLGAAMIGGRKDTERDRQLSALARQKQQTDLPMTPEVRLQAYEKRETIRPEAKMTCPNGHKITATMARKALATHDVVTCAEDGCGALCGGADVHPLHLEIRHLHLADKNKYVDSCRWLSKSETEVQTREYIKGHPLVYPHLSSGVLFNDETDAWHGYTLAWNIFFWFGDIATYWTRVRREMEERAGGDLDDEEQDGDAEEERGRGKRKRRKIAVDQHADGDAEGEEAEEAQIAAATAASLAEHKQRVKPSTDSSAATAAAASSTAASPNADERKTGETIELD